MTSISAKLNLEIEGLMLKLIPTRKLGRLEEEIYGAS